MVGIKNVLPLFCVNNCVSQGLDLVISTEHAPNLKKLTQLIADYSGLTRNVAYGQIQIENYKVVFFGDLLVYKINSLYTF